MKQIIDVQDIAEQGFSQPFRCRDEILQEYYVKGRRSSRSSQINEWLCANMAKALNLPIAPFCLLTVAEEILELLPLPLRNIGKGAAFASHAQTSCTLFELSNIQDIPETLQRQLAAFDWFIQNMDRTQGNPNLLYNPQNKQIIVIDHNLAFDPEFNQVQFCQTYIFQAVAKELAQDWVYQQEAEQWLLPAIDAYHHAKSKLPPEWAYINDEQDLPTQYPFERIETQINRLKNGTLWSNKV